MAQEGLLPLMGAESTGEKWRAVCVARRKKRVTEAVVRRRIDRKRSFVCLSEAQPGTQGRFARQRKKPWSGDVSACGRKAFDLEEERICMRMPSVPKRKQTPTSDTGASSPPKPNM